MVDDNDEFENDKEALRQSARQAAGTVTAWLVTGIHGASVEGSTYDVAWTLGGTRGAQGMPRLSSPGGDLILKNVLFTCLTWADQPVCAD